MNAIPIISQFRTDAVPDPDDDLTEQAHEALRLAKSGVPIFPCNREKAPLTEHGFKDASCEEKQVQSWWEQFPYALIGIPTGKVSGMDVLDIDRKSGKDGFAALRALGVDLPVTRTHTTPSGGKHLLMRSASLACSTSKIAPGVDVRGEGGYVIWWPAAGYSVENADVMVEVPHWVIDYAQKTGNPPVVASETAQATFVDASTVRDLRSALASLRADNYDLWIRIGLALKTIGDQGRALWIEWSQTSKKWKSSDAQRWDTFKPTETDYKVVFSEAQKLGWLNPKSNAATNQHDPQAGEHARDVNLIRGSDVIPEPITWLWNGWLAAGKMHVFGGAPGTGKTTISMALAATVTTAGRWPDGTQSIAGNVVIWSGEDDPADTLIPRLILAGANLSRVYFIADIRDGNERRSFDPARDMEPLQRKLAEIGGVRLLIVDPVVSAIAGDSHKNAEVRRGLQPLADLAASMRCAILGITHFSKGTSGRDPVERLTGSLAFGALARVVLVAAKHQEEGEDGRTVRLFCRAKSNIGPDDGGFEYDLQQAELRKNPGIFASSVLWGETVEGAARELLATADATSDDGEGGTLAEAKRFLADLLADGPLQSKTIKADADGAGYSLATIRRAQKALGIKPVKKGMKAGWVWSMPGQESEWAGSGEGDP